MALVQGPLESGSLTGPVEMKLRGQRDGAFGHKLATLLDLGRGVLGVTTKAGGERRWQPTPCAPLPVLRRPSCHTQNFPRSVSLFPPEGAAFKKGQSPGDIGKQKELRIDIPS